MNIQELKARTLILTQTDPDDDMMFSAWKNAGLSADIIFKPQNKFVRMIRRLWADGMIPGCSLWYGDWKKSIEKYNTVIVHADMRTRTVPLYIHKVKPEMRVIYWYWNPVNKDTLPQLTRDDRIECWSFDEKDCEKFHMKKNVQYYYEQDDVENGGVEYDVYFVGHDKGRRRTIEKIVKQLETQNLHGRFDLIRETEPIIPYLEVQERIKKTRAILEVNQEGQVGCTLRALEALFFRKKLITTNLSIEKEEFYNPKNIFIIGKDDLKGLHEFVYAPYDMKSDRFKDEHTIDAWFMNFFLEEHKCCF